MTALERIEKTNPTLFPYFYLLYHTGLRVSEILEFNKLIVFPYDYIIFPSSKKSEQRLITSSIIPLKYFDYVMDNVDYFYHTYAAQLSEILLNNMPARKYYHKKKLLTTHLFRHNYIKLLLNIHGLNPSEIQKIVGHKSISNTFRYINSEISCF